MKEYKYKINGNEYNVAVEELEGNKANVTVNGKTYEVELDKPAKPEVSKPVARPAAAAAPSAAPAPKAAPAAPKVEAPVTEAPKAAAKVEAPVESAPAAQSEETK